MKDQSICLYHNGNSRIVEHYRNKFANLKFCGNWAEAGDKSATGCLWEICFADANFANLLSAHAEGVKIVRHISTYDDDMEHLLPECQRFDYPQWLEYAVTANLCLAQDVISDLCITPGTQNATVIITTGRTANMHLQEVYAHNKKLAFESSKKLDSIFFNARDSVFLWRTDQWACLTSTWIAQQTDYQKAHQVEGQRSVEFNKQVAPLDISWIETDWVNMCKITLDQALLSKYVCNRPTSHTTTEFITANFKSIQQAISYRKQDLIPNYNEMYHWYQHSNLAKNLTIVYNNVVNHLTFWSM